MRLINIFNEDKKADKRYHLLPQPMTVYHSTEELLLGEGFGTLEEMKASKNAYLVTNYDEFIYLMNSIRTVSGANEYDIRHFNAWFKSKDQFIPTICNNSSDVQFQLDENGNKIPTDGCYVRVYYIIFSYNRFSLITSAGINNIFLTKWDITAAIREDYRNSTGNPKNVDKTKKYEEYKNRIFARTKPSSAHIRLVHSLFNPMGNLFLNFPKAMKLAFPTIHKNDYENLLQTKAFRSAIMELIKSLQPELKTSILKEMPADEVAKWIKQMVTNTLEGDNFKDKKEALEFIIDKAYTDNTIMNAGVQVPLLPQQPNQPLLPSNPKMIDESGTLEEESLEDIKGELNYPEGFVNENMYEDFNPNSVKME